MEGSLYCDVFVGAGDGGQSVLCDVFVGAGDGGQSVL